MNIDVCRHQALFIASLVVTGNPTGLGRKVSSRFGTQCVLAPVPKTLGARLEFLIEIPDNELNSAIADPDGYARKVQGFILATVDILDRFSV